MGTSLQVYILTGKQSNDLTSKQVMPKLIEIPRPDNFRVEQNESGQPLSVTCEYEGYRYKFTLNEPLSQRTVNKIHADSDEVPPEASQYLANCLAAAFFRSKQDAPYPEHHEQLSGYCRQVVLGKDRTRKQRNLLADVCDWHPYMWGCPFASLRKEQSKQITHI